RHAAVPRPGRLEIASASAAGAREPLEELVALTGTEPADAAVGGDPQLLHRVDRSARTDTREVLQQDLHPGPGDRLVLLGPVEHVLQAQVTRLQVMLHVGPRRPRLDRGIFGGSHAPTERT